jgi:hypothetical protein
MVLGVSKKKEKTIKPRKQKKNNRKNQTMKKNRLNRLEFKKTDRFGLISLKPKKLNRNGSVFFKNTISIPPPKKPLQATTLKSQSLTLST